MRQVTILLLFAFLAPCAFATIPWPMEPFAQPHPLGNSYGEYQYYGGSPYMHPGIDILDPAGTPVHAVKAGWVKAVLTISAELHWRVAIGDSPGAEECDGWLYAHLDMTSIVVQVGDYVDSGQYLGNLVAWPVADFHHLHFVKIRHSGLTWTSDWQFVGNALDELVGIQDFDAPYFMDITPGYKLSFCQDNTNNFFTPGAPVYGGVDIITKAHDRVGHPAWELTPYALGYEIHSDSVFLGPFVSFVFTGELLWDQATLTVFKRAAPCLSRGDYDDRDFYEILTNHDNDTLIMASDVAGKWETGVIPNDVYRVKFWASDRYGNVTWDSMDVATENYYEISGSVTFSDDNPDLVGNTVSIPFSGGNVLTEEDGNFLLPSQPAGRYAVQAERVGYQALSEIHDVFSNTTIPLVMEPSPYAAGDVDHNGIVNISDAVYLIAFIFGGGAYPVPWAAAVDIDSSPIVNISDAVYLIAYIFGSGPAPGEGK